MTRSPASNRAYETVTLSFGLISVPIAVYTGTVSDHGIKRKWFTEDGAEVGYATVNKDTRAEIPRSEIVTKIATEYGHVYVEDHEIETLFEIAPKTLVVKAFQPQHLFYAGGYVPKKPYFVEVPKVKIGSKKVDNAKGQQVLGLVLEVMREEGAVAFVEFTTRGVPKPAVLMSDGTLWELYHEDELREQRPLPQVDLPEALVEQGRGLIKALWSDDVIDTTDKRSELIQAFADEKAQAGDFTKPEDVAVEAPAVDTSSDLLAMLSASVEAAKAKSA